jgi:glucokinase
VENHSGLGSGVILDGRLFTGSAGVASELGHTSIDRHGPRCPCGNYGCVELYSSGPAIIRRIQELHEQGASTRLTEIALRDLAGLTFDQVIQAAQDGDSLAARALREASLALGLGLVNAINLIDPEAVIIGHKLNRAGAIALDPIRAVIQEQAIPQAAARLNVLTSQLADPVPVTGAACRALSGLLQNPALLLEGALSHS